MANLEPFLTRKHLGTDTELFEVIENIRLDPFQPGFGTAALERCAQYFSLTPDGTLEVSQDFLRPKVEHYNYDYFAGIQVTMDIRNPVGSRR